VIAFAFLGLVLCAINLLSFKLQYSLSEYTTGTMFLLSGVVFPVSMLPVIAQQIGNALPSTYFLNLIRLALSGSSEFTVDLAYMVLSTIGFAISALLLFKLAEYRARNRGMIDRKAEY
jgi:ABC-2 type transport system permease protein